MFGHDPLNLCWESVLGCYCWNKGTKKTINLLDYDKVIG